MPEIDLAPSGQWSYGFAALGFAALAVRLLLGWRLGPRAALLLSATIGTAVWACAGLAAARWPGYAA